MHLKLLEEQNQLMQSNTLAEVENAVLKFDVKIPNLAVFNIAAIYRGTLWCLKMRLVGSKDIVDVDMDLVELYPKLSAQIVIENIC